MRNKIDNLIDFLADCRGSSMVQEVLLTSVVGLSVASVCSVVYESTWIPAIEASACRVMGFQDSCETYEAEEGEVEAEGLDLSTCEGWCAHQSETFKESGAHAAEAPPRSDGCFNYDNCGLASLSWSRDMLPEGEVWACGSLDLKADSEDCADVPEEERPPDSYFED